MNDASIMELAIAALAGGSAGYVGMRVAIARLEERLTALKAEIDNQVTHARERYDIMKGRLDAIEARTK